MIASTPPHKLFIANVGHDRGAAPRERSPAPAGCGARRGGEGGARRGRRHRGRQRDMVMPLRLSSAHWLAVTRGGVAGGGIVSMARPQMS